MKMCLSLVLVILSLASISQAHWIIVPPHEDLQKKVWAHPNLRLSSAAADFVKGKPVSAEQWQKLQLLADKGDNSARILQALSYFYGAYVKKDEERAFKELLTIAQEGSQEAQVLYGELVLWHGYGDTALADKYLLSAANRGDVGAQRELARYYRFKKPKIYHHWIQQAAMQGDVFACASLSVSYSRGEQGFKRDRCLSLYWSYMAYNYSLKDFYHGLGDLKMSLVSKIESLKHKPQMLAELQAAADKGEEWAKELLYMYNKEK